MSFFLLSFSILEEDIDKDIKAEESKVEMQSISIDSFFNLTYPLIQFDQDTLDEKVFKMALSGYAKLKNEDALAKDSILAVIDYSLSSTKRRLWVFNLNSKKVLLNEWVAHGKNTGGEYARKFSNKGKSRMSSIGFMVTGKIYNGKHKSSLKLNGYEPYYNTNVHSRGVVIHGANYVKSELALSNIAMGRSFGCPAVRKEVNEALIYTINEGVCLFSYYPNIPYLTRSKYVNYTGMLKILNTTISDSTATNL
jgi:hypothetical protein